MKLAIIGAAEANLWIVWTLFAPLRSKKTLTKYIIAEGFSDKMFVFLCVSFPGPQADRSDHK